LVRDLVDLFTSLVKAKVWRPNAGFSSPFSRPLADWPLFFSRIHLKFVPRFTILYPSSNPSFCFLGSFPVLPPPFPFCPGALLRGLAPVPASFCAMWFFFYSLIFGFPFGQPDFLDLLLSALFLGLSFPLSSSLRHFFVSLPFFFFFVRAVDPL